ncbi:protein of unknown function [Klenkia marina]|uniref:DUF4194 domain-containing protein n=1 Tax=Klenkia marina TaxID=1960309 RepID=A0A1G4YSD9_9ACTN|nr:DUF4194 domain-containing protein [Klenkia marina]SCX56372.1 protein of unknown function [Klenkia marina]
MTALLPEATSSTSSSTTSPTSPRAELSLPLVVTSLMRGVVYREAAPEVWRHLVALQPDLRDHVATMGLVAVVDEAEGYAFLRQRPEEPAEGGPAIPRLVARRSLSYPVSLLLALLRRRLAVADTGDTGGRLVLSRLEIVDLVADLLPDPGRRNRLLEQVDGHIAKVVELGFLRRMPGGAGGSDGRFEVRRVLKAFVDAQWLADFDTKLAEYAATQQTQPAVEDLP